LIPLAALADAQQSDAMPPGGFVATCAAEGSGSNHLVQGDSLL
jgi:hypothetical protein